MAKLDWKQIVGTVAPALATAFGTPLAGAATAAVARAVLGKDKASDAELAAVLTSPDPETLFKLRQADQQFAVRLRELDIDVERLRFADMQSARQRQVDLRDRTPTVLAAVIVSLTFVIEGWVMFTGLPQGVDGVIVGRVLGTLDAALIMVLQYYFGASRREHSKDDALAAIAEQPTQVVVGTR